ncbi:inositol 1,4,5-triphosphate receptor associated 2-like isoform X2 [Cylas formicarius]|nr:inositol 1,4,5-triphosphate receptor associated 2-like isoform X2 [Cylas formicarius]
MGLHGDAPKELLSEETLEQKFTSLSLAFAIDAATIKDRRERQRRTRDQTENNLAQEIEKLRGKLALLEPLCTDFESAELLSILLAQIEIITKASSLASIAAERYGAVQHEDRLTESVQLMVNHVQALKHQRDSARRQLQYTKRVLQGVPENPSANPAAPQKLLLNANRKFITRRRASLGTVNTAHDQNANKLSRRTSDLSIRATSLTKGGRPNRLELGGELLKIKEDFAHEAVVEQLHKQVREEEEDEEANLDANSLKEEMIVKKIESSLGSAAPLSNISFRNNILARTFSNKFKLSLEDIRHELSERLKNWSENDYFYAFFNFCAVVCFSISILTLVRMYLEYEYTKRDYTESYFSWFWPTNKPGSAKYKKK